MSLTLAINGFGRIGRMVFRALAERSLPSLKVVAINDLGSLEANMHLLRYDSVHGRFPGEVSSQNNLLSVETAQGNLKDIRILCESNPDRLPWKDLKVDLVLECSGRFTNRADAERHLTAGAKRVLVSAPAEGVDATIVYGVNHSSIQPHHHILSNASCTTNCLAPLASALHQAVGIEKGYMTTIHSYTGDQRLIDTLHSDLRRARSAPLSMIPSSTGAARALGLVLPELAGKLDGTAIRVPTPNVSVVDLTFVSSRPTSISEINTAIYEASKTSLKGILSYEKDPLVSIDFNHNTHSSCFDSTQTQVVDGNFCRVLSWYDNEWGFSNRMVDVACYLSAL